MENTIKYITKAIIRAKEKKELKSMYLPITPADLILILSNAKDIEEEETKEVMKGYPEITEMTELSFKDNEFSKL